MPLKSHDVEFKMKSGDHVGEKYPFTLAKSSNLKMWRVVRLRFPAPKMTKERIEMGIAVRGQDISLSGAVDLVRANEVMDQLDIIAKETTPVTLIGLDNKERDVRVDIGGYSLETVAGEKWKDAEYVVRLTCWSVYE